MAYVDGISLQGIITSATIWSTVIAGVVASIYVFRLVKRKRSPQRSNPHQSPSQQDTEEEAMNAADFRLAAMMIAGTGVGFTIGLALFTETYALVASSIVGCVAGPIIAKWLDRRMRE
ncbi:MAG: hypothetical protein OXJ53_02580 [Gammaproteobacteria bacterium]|nr:hypothetical protein [Gammaproteobacteria bacterium]MDD9964225.1 hypothetical protein [Gammaproteobacteria bacterium]MDE0272779.1 hypothetical protein [Gammaproteobacteria bacterium]